MNIFQDVEQPLTTDNNNGSVFGESSQIKVIGYFRKGKYDKRYVVECSTCKQDPELFGKGLFVTSLQHLKLGKIPCGCSKVPKWSVEQQFIRSKRVIESLGYKLARMENYRDQQSKITITCQEHGEWESTVSAVINKGVYCKGCYPDRKQLGVRKPEEEMVSSFLSSGTFHPESKFWRSSRKNSKGQMVYWYVYCPICDSTGESTSSDLQRGYRSCNCYKNPKQAYLNLVKDSDGSIVAIKFGITSNFKDRLFRQNLRSVFSVENYGIWEFDSKSTCYNAELQLKRTVECGVLSKQEMYDGWTETTFPHNIEIVVSTFEDFGGVRLT